MPGTVSVGIGIAEFPFSGNDHFWNWIDLCEAGGIDSIWQSDRLTGAAPVLESLTALAAIAGRTRRLKFGMNVISLAFREPVLLAKQCATIDVLSNGRMLPAFGIGSPLGGEWKALQIDPTTRGARADEALQLIRRLWTEERVDFDGRFYRLSGVSMMPKPLQRELPMWIGGSSAAAIRRTANYGTGWQSGVETPAEAGKVIAAIKVALQETGREIDADHYGVNVAFRFGQADEPVVVKALQAYRRFGRTDPLALIAVGDAKTIIDRISAYIDQGAYKFVLRPVAAGDDDIMTQTKRLCDEILPAVAARWPAPRRSLPQPRG
jgi:probable F420-dependent oxidoreductase